MVLTVVGGAGKLRSADCVAEGRVQVVVINKKDFMDLDNPLLAWMLDSDAVTTVLRVRRLFLQISSSIAAAFTCRVKCHSVQVSVHQVKCISLQ